MESVEDEVMRKDDRLASRTRTERERERERRIVGAAVNILYITDEARPVWDTAPFSGEK